MKKLIYSIYTWDPSWGTWRWILTWPPSVLQSLSSGLFSPLSERWFHSSVWSWHLNSAEGISCLKSRCKHQNVFQNCENLLKHCLLNLTTLQSSTTPNCPAIVLSCLISLSPQLKKRCWSPHTVGVEIGSHRLTCVLWRSCWLMARRSSSCCRSSIRASCFSQMSFSSIFMDISISCFIPICTSSSFSTSCEG